jgi:O-antigen/teichoic acid export membrane protein
MACRGSGVQIPSAPLTKMNISYIKKIFLETKELFTSQALIAILSLVQVSYVVKQLGAEKYGVITLFVTFISLFFRALHSKNSDVALLAFKKEDKNIFYPALLFDFLIGVLAMILCLTIYLTPYFSKINIENFSMYLLLFLFCRTIFNFSETSKATLINTGKLKILSSMELSGILIRFFLIISLISIDPTIQNYLLGQSLYLLSYGLIAVAISRKEINTKRYESKMNFREYWLSVKNIYKKIRYDQVLGLIPQHFDILLLSLLGDLTLVGIYKFAKRLVEPINYIVTGFNPWIQNQYSNRKKIDFSDFVKKLLLPLSTVILLIFITTGKKIIELIGSNEFASAYEPMIILTFGYLIYLLTFWIRQALLFNELIIYHAYGRLIYSFVFIILSIPLTYFFNVAGLAYSLSSAIALQKIFEYIVYKKKIISE